MRTALAQRDIGRVYTLLTAAGISQYSIAWLTGQSQSEVSEMARRQLARAAEGWVPEGRADQATMDEARGGGDRAPSTPGPAQTPGSWPVWPAASPPPGHSRNPPGRSALTMSWSSTVGRGGGPLALPHPTSASRGGRSRARSPAQGDPATTLDQLTPNHYCLKSAIMCQAGSAHRQWFRVALRSNGCARASDGEPWTASSGYPGSSYSRGMLSIIRSGAAGASPDTKGHRIPRAEGICSTRLAAAY